jgi:dinuclear metal center YbgI/SA1388 family protein
MIDEAIDSKCNMVVSHHPIVFKGLKKLTGSNYVERTLIKAIRNDITVYALHTNLDNVSSGVNRKIGERLGIENCAVLSPKRGQLRKLVVFVPHSEAEKVRQAMFAAGAGAIGNYDECSFNTEGTGTFRPLEGSNPVIGLHGTRQSEPETKVEVIFESYRERQIMKAMEVAHPYETVAYDLFSLENIHQDIGSGMVGDLTEPMDEREFLQGLKQKLNTQCVRHTALLGKSVRRIAWCGGSGSFLLQSALAAGADVFITGDFKYHEFFDAEERILIADVGHYESEQFTTELIADYLKTNANGLLVLKTNQNTNPVYYL